MLSFIRTTDLIRFVRINRAPEKNDFYELRVFNITSQSPKHNEKFPMIQYSKTRLLRSAKDG